jgi:hypothetical protein
MKWLTAATSVLFVLTGQCRQAQGKLGGDVSIKREQDEARIAANWEEVFPRLHLRDVTIKSDRQLQDLTSYGGSPDPERLPLGLCEGDCDDDTDVRFRAEPQSQLFVFWRTFPAACIAHVLFSNSKLLDL